MAAKVIDVTLATIQNVGDQSVSPDGTILCKIVRAVDDEQVFQSELLYTKNPGQPMHPSGATSVPPGQSLTYNVTKRLTVHHFDQETEGHLNQMLIFAEDLKQRHVVLGSVREEPYFGPFNSKVRFDEIDGFKTISLPYSASSGGTPIGKIEVVFTVNLVA